MLHCSWNVVNSSTVDTRLHLCSAPHCNFLFLLSIQAIFVTGRWHKWRALGVVPQSTARFAVARLGGGRRTASHAEDEQTKSKETVDGTNDKLTPTPNEWNNARLIELIEIAINLQIASSGTEARRDSRKSPDSSSTCSSREPSPVAPRPTFRRQSTTEEILIARGFRRQSTTEEMIRCRNFR